MRLVNSPAQALRRQTASALHDAQAHLGRARHLRRCPARASVSASTLPCPGYDGQVQDKSLWPSWFEGSILAKADILQICPYPVVYPPNKEAEGREFRGWKEGSKLKDNKQIFFDAIANFNTGKAREEQIKPWEQQLLFAMAMQETEAMCGGDDSKTGDSENFSCLNMNYDALHKAGCFQQDEERTLKLLRFGSEKDKLAKVLPYTMKWLWGQVDIQQDLLNGNKPGLAHAKGATLASALNYHRGGSTGFGEPNAYLLVSSYKSPGHLVKKGDWPDTYGCNHYRNAIVTTAYAISVAKGIYKDENRIAVSVPGV